MKFIGISQCLLIASIPLFVAIQAEAKEPSLLIGQQSSNVHRPASQKQAPSFDPAQAATSDEPIRIIQVELIPTETGLEVILSPSNGQFDNLSTSVMGNALVIDIPNAVLDLSDGDDFLLTNPAEGLALVAISNRSDSRVQVAITGRESPPTVDVRTDVQTLLLTITPGEMGAVGTAEMNEGTFRIIFTAEKTPEDLQTVPISITALTEQDIEDANISSLSGIAASTPNFSILPIGGDSRYFVNYSIRGLSNSNFVSRDAVGFYIDDIPYDYGSFINTSLIDLERIEVLRGPQSTLYGRNAQAGVVNIITHPPSNEFEFRTDISYGSYNSLNTQASVNAPLIDNELFFRLSGGYARRDGYIDNTFLDKDFGRQSGGIGRARLLWMPTDTWEIALGGSFEEYDDDAPVLLQLTDSNISDTEQDFDGFSDLTSNTQSLRVAYNGPTLRFTSITARRFSEQETRYDGDSTSADIVIPVAAFDSTVVSQEFRLQSPENTEQFDWLVGGYFESRQFDANGEGFIVGVDGARLFGGAGRDRTDAETDQTTLAGFGQISYRPVDALTLTAGLRYETVNTTLENRQRVFELANSPVTIPLIEPLENVKQDGDELLPRFAVDYRINPNLMVYGSIARGYKPSGVNYRAQTDETLRFDAETSLNYELGFKSSWLGDRFRLNFALFHNDVNNYQVALPDTVGIPREIANADVGISGFEIEARARPAEGFDITAGLGLIDGTFNRYTNPFTGETFNGNILPYAPNLTYNLAAQYRHPIGLLGRIELQGFGKTFFDDSNTLKQDPFTLVNARLGYESEKYGVYLFASNIFDTEYVTAAYVFGPVGSVGSYGAPATVGVQVRAQF